MLRKNPRRERRVEAARWASLSASEQSEERGQAALAQENEWIWGYHLPSGWAPVWIRKKWFSKIRPRTLAYSEPPQPSKWDHMYYDRAFPHRKPVSESPESYEPLLQGWHEFQGRWWDNAKKRGGESRQCEIYHYEQGGVKARCYIRPTKDLEPIFTKLMGGDASDRSKEEAEVQSRLFLKPSN